MQPTALSSAWKRAIRLASMTAHSIACLLLAIPLILTAGETPAAEIAPTTAEAEQPATSPKVTPELEAALAKLNLPGVKIDAEKWCVDIDATVCLVEGMLELIACTKNTKEHESIIAVNAKPSHIHIALLLLRAKPGHPATHQAINAERTQFFPVPPSGSPVDVFVVIKDANGKDTEHPISDFLIGANPYGEPREGEEDAKPAKFPTHTFLFAGSILDGQDGGPRNYASDSSGNVISLSTFGDELLCLPGIHDQADSLRMWQVNGEKLPALDSKVILRLRPQVKPPGKPPAAQ